ncbi:hypothetical protein FA15DRAFT_668352 [Coprinopsis marcescibilis]|uniref:Uncharacterized protein n=1 Tax=Coprinopsis marcescibilis TaxID=230819 RepID=A0A5C3KXV0_COPMA|nr:hypothetical protein FA15DRAFT_668352 [Coprinopsis marcescibilis]
MQALLHRLHRLDALVLTSEAVPDKEILPYLRNVASLAQQAAADYSCASILAGQGSEADDLGDDQVVWLGPGDFQRPENILAAMGLDTDTEIHRISLTQHGLPPTLHVTGPNTALDKWGEEMERLEDRYCFRISVPQESQVLFFLAGSLPSSDWVVLVGAGVSSD